MRRSKSSSRWLSQQRKDIYVKRSKEENYPSRAAYKLIELDKKYRLLGKNKCIVDLGAAPGGWSKVAAEILDGSGKVVGVDLLKMQAIAGVEFIHGDFTEDSTLSALHAILGDSKVDLVMSDMAPNFSGILAVDQMRSMRLAEEALQFAEKVLSSNGDFLAKVFQGEGYIEFLALLRDRFARVVTSKPDASRNNSREMYVVAKGYKSLF